MLYKKNLSERDICTKFITPALEKSGWSKLEKIIAGLNKYTIKGQFKFSPDDVLSQVCNIPVKRDYSGIYLFYEMDNRELIYIGMSGRNTDTGEIIHRKDGLRGRFLTGKQFDSRRSKSLPIQMRIEHISGLEIYWFVTYGDDSKDIPKPIEKLLIKTFKNENENKWPRWNKMD